MKIFSLLDIQYNAYVARVQTYLSKMLSEHSTKFGSNTIFGQILTIIGNVIQNIMLYIEDSLVEQNKYTAQRKKSIYGLAALSGYKPSYGKASTVTLKMNFVPYNNKSYNSNESPVNLIINNHEQVTCTQNGLVYNLILPQESIVMNPNKDNHIKYITAVQGRFETQRFISSGGQYYTIHVRFNGNMDTDYISVKVNNEKWDYCESLYDMDSNKNQYTWKTALDGGIILIFGNGQHGKPLFANDVVEISYLVHDGEIGNLNPQLETYFTFDNQLQDVNGESYDGNMMFNVTFANTDPITSGSNSESVDTVRHMIGMNSRSLVLASPQNYKMFISRFGFVGYNRTWSNANTMIVNSLILKNFKSIVGNGKDYFKLKHSDFILTDAQKKSIHDCIESSGNQLAGVKYQIHDPEICKYAMYLYISLKNNKNDREFIKNMIRQLVGNFFTNIESDIFVPKSDIITLIKNNIDSIDGVDVYLLSQKNEEAIITGKYVENGELVKIYDGENPNLGLDSHGNIWLKNDNEFPVLMGGWKYKNDEGDEVEIVDPLIITFEE
jgi:hypothetical protein